MRPWMSAVVAGALDDRGVVVVDGDLLGRAQVGQRDVLQVDAQVLDEDLAAGEDGDVLQHGLAAVAVAGGLDGADVEDAAQLVDHQRRQGLALDVLGDDQQRPLGLGDLLQQRDQLGDVGDLLLVDQDERLLQLALHRVGVGHEVRREVAAVELHALDDVDGRLDALAFLDGDDAVPADLAHRLGDHLADLGVVVGAMAAMLRMSASSLTGLGQLWPAPSMTASTALRMPRPDAIGVGAGGQVAVAFLEDRLGQHGGGGGAVAGGVGGLAGGLLDELGAHVLVLVGQLDLLGDGHAVLGDGRGAPALVEDGVAAAGAQGALDRPGQLLHANEQGLSRVALEFQLLCRHRMLLLVCRSTFPVFAWFARPAAVRRPIRSHRAGEG